MRRETAPLSRRYSLRTRLPLSNQNHNMNDPLVENTGHDHLAAPLAIDTLHPSHSSGNCRSAGSNEFDSQMKKAETSRAHAIPPPLRPSQSFRFLPRPRRK